MSTLWRATLLLASVALAGTPVAAQERADLRAGLTAAALPSAALAFPVGPSDHEAFRHESGGESLEEFHAEVRRAQRRWPYVVGGAVAGAAAGALFYWNSTRDTGDGDFLFPYTLIATMGLGAGVGALLGLGVSEVVGP